MHKLFIFVWLESKSKKTRVRKSLWIEMPAETLMMQNTHLALAKGATLNYIFNWICIEQRALFYGTPLCLTVCALGQAAKTLSAKLQLLDEHWTCSNHIIIGDSVESILNGLVHTAAHSMRVSWKVVFLERHWFGHMFVQHQILFQFNLAFTVLLLYLILFCLV